MKLRSLALDSGRTRIGRNKASFLLSTLADIRYWNFAVNIRVLTPVTKKYCVAESLAVRLAAQLAVQLAAQLFSRSSEGYVA